MTEEFISVSDRIISASIDIISDAGLESLTTANISMRINLSEVMIYKYFSDIDEILKEVVCTYFKFDKSIFRTLKSKDVCFTDRLMEYVRAYSSYYDSYYSLSAIMLQYEELLHNIHTREQLESGYLERRNGLIELFQGAIDNDEIIFEDANAEELADHLLGLFIICSLNRRVMYRRMSYKDEMISMFTRWLNTFSRKKY
ncbi:MAG: TetR family transcriptional regulator [Eubacterium sp.]|nr:TetR family transcriptional regulator [Eubacterium sp.]